MEPVTRTILISLLMVCTSAAIVAIGALYRRIRILERESEALKTKVEPFWSVVQARMAKELTHPHVEFHEADALLAKLVDGEIDEGERSLLLELLEARVIDPNPKVGLPERKTAGGMAFVMEKAQEEAMNDAPIKEFLMVGVKVEEHPEGD